MEFIIFLILCIYIVHNAYIKRIVESFCMTFSIFPIYRARNLPWQGDFAPKLIKIAVRVTIIRNAIFLNYFRG